MRIVAHDYGKARVRLLKVRRRGEIHDVRELTVRVMCEGDFAETYVTGDNRRVLATDTMKNSVYAMARREPVDRVETYGLALAEHFVKSHAPIAKVTVDLEEREWVRIDTGKGMERRPHPHAFRSTGAGYWTARVVNDRKSGVTLESGLVDLRVMKTTGSGFEGFPRDAWTTLPETKDRILATEIQARWRWGTHPKDFAAANHTIRDAMLQAFAEQYSPSVQHTLHQMAAAALAACAQVAEIRLSLPNLHCNKVDLSAFDMDNPDEVYVPTDEPHGLIEATLARE